MKGDHTTPRVKRGRRKSLKSVQEGGGPAYVVSTLAGDGSGTWREGTGTSSSLNSPRCLAVTPSGSILVAESSSAAIRLISQDGVTSTLAGPRQISSLGSQDGKGPNASFYQPNAMACAKDGTVYTADYSYHLVRKIMPDGTATTIAGLGRGDSTDAVGRSAGFNQPFSVALNPEETILYVGDTGNNMVRKVSLPSFTVTTFCAQIQAMGIIVAQNGTVYMACNDHRIYSLPASGGGRNVKPPVFVGSGNQGYSDGQGTGCTFNQPKQLAIDEANNLYLADSGNNMIRMITPAGVVTTVVGTQNGGFVDGLKAVARFNYPWGITIDKTGNLYVADTNNNRIRKLSLITPPSVPVVKLISKDSISATLTWTGGTSVVPTVYSYRINGGPPVAVPPTITGPPLTIPLPSGGTTFNVSLIASNDAGSSPSDVAGQGGGGQAQAGGADLTVTTAPPMKTSTFTFVGTRGSAGSVNGVGTLALLNTPNGVTLDASGNAYIADMNNHCIRKVTPYGLTTTFAGTPTVAGYVDNTLATAQFRNPRDITTDTAGNMYVTDTGNNVIRKISTLGIVTTFAGNTSGGYLDGTGAAADFNTPSSATCDPSGNVFVTDTNNHCIRKITPAGVVTTFAGINNAGLVDGTGKDARFNSPSGIVYDAFSKRIYVADTNNHSIRAVTLNGVVTTFAGNNSNGKTDGIGTLADFNAPTGIATDASGYVFVSDVYNHLVRKIAPGGLVSTYSGSNQGWADGTTTISQFNSIQGNVQHNTPTGMATDASGNLYVTETGNHVLRIVTPKPRPVPPTSITIGSVTTNSATINWSGGSGATSFTFAMFPPTPGIVIPVVASSPGTITGLSDGARYTIYVVSINAAGPILSAPFSFVTMLSEPVLTVGPKDAIVTNPTANNPVPGDATALIRWTGAASADSITYKISPNDLQNRSSVTMPNNQTSPFMITNMKPETSYTVSLAATKANVPGANPAAYTAASNTVSFTTPASQTVTVYPIAGIANSRGRTNDISGAKCTFDMPRGITMDGNGVLYVSDRIIVRKITGPPGTSYYSYDKNVPGAVPQPLAKTPILPGPVVTNYVGSMNAGQPSYSPTPGPNAQFYNMYGLTFDPFSGCLYATEQAYHRIVRITPGAGNPTVVVLAGDREEYTNGTGNAANFRRPQGICAGKNGLIYIADCDNDCIRVMTPAGAVTTAAGPQPGQRPATNAATNGPASTVGFNRPKAVTADALGNIYIADFNNHCIRYLNNATSTVMTIAGGGQNGNSSGYSDGQGLNAYFRNPSGLALDPSGNLYVYDSGNLRIRRITPTGYVTTIAGNGSNGSTYGAGNTVSISSNRDDEHCGLCSDGLGNIYFADSGSGMVKVISTAPKPLPANHPSIAAFAAEQERLKASAAAAAKAALVASQAQVVASQAAVEASQAAVVASSAKQVASQAEASQALQAASQAKVLQVAASQAAQVASQAAQVASSARQVASQAQASQAQASHAQASQAAQVASQAAQTASSARQVASQAQASQAQASHAQASQAAQVASQAAQAASSAQKQAASSALFTASSALQQSSQAQASQALQQSSQAQASSAVQQASRAQASQAAQVASSALQQSSQAQASQAAQSASSALQVASQAYQSASAAIKAAVELQQYNIASQAQKVASAALARDTASSALQVSSQAQASQAAQNASSALQVASQAQSSQAAQAASSALQVASQAQASQALQAASSALQQSSQAQASSALQQASRAQASQAAQTASSALQVASQAQLSRAQASQAAQVASSALQVASQAQASQAAQTASSALQVASQAQASRAQASQAAQVASSALELASRAQASQAALNASSALQVASQAQASQAAQNASSALQVASQAQVSQAAQAASSALQQSSQAQASQAQASQAQYLSVSQAMQAASSAKQQAASSALQVASQAEQVASQALQEASQAEFSKARASQAAQFASSALQVASQAQASQALQQNSQAQASQAVQVASSALQQNSQAQASQALQHASSALQQSSQAEASQAQVSQAAQVASSALQQNSQAQASQALQQSSQAQASQALQVASQAQASQAQQEASQAIQVASQAYQAASAAIKAAVELKQYQVASQAQQVASAALARDTASSALQVASQAQASQAAQTASSALQVASQAQASQALQESSQAQASQALQQSSQAQASTALQVASSALEQSSQAQASQAAQFASSAQQMASQAQASQALQQSSQAQVSQAQVSQAQQVASQAVQVASSALQQSSQAQNSQAQASQAGIFASQAQVSQAQQEASQASITASQAARVASQAEAVQIAEAIRNQVSQAQAESSQAQASQAFASQALSQASQAQAQASEAQASQAQASQAQASQAQASQAQASQAKVAQASQAAAQASQAAAVQASQAYATNLAGLANPDVSASSTAATALGTSVQAQVAALTASGNYVDATQALTGALQALRSSPAFIANDPATVALVTTLTNLEQTTIATNPNMQASAATEASAIVTSVTSLEGSNPQLYAAAAVDIEKIANSQVGTLLASGSYTQAANTLTSMIGQVMNSAAFKSNSPTAVALVNSLAVMKQKAIAADPSTTAAAKASQAALAVKQIQAAATAIQTASAPAPAAASAPAPAPAASAPVTATAPVTAAAPEAEFMLLNSGTPEYGEGYENLGNVEGSNEGIEVPQEGGAKAFRKSRKRVKATSRRKSRNKSRSKVRKN